MATMGFRLIAGKPNVVWLPEDETSGSFVAGDCVALSSGEVIKAAAATDVFGIALKAASGTVSTSIPVSVVTPEQIWCAEADATTANTIVGGPYDINLTAGSMAVNLGTGTAGVVIQELDPRDGATTGSGGRVRVRFAYGTADAVGG